MDYDQKFDDDFRELFTERLQADEEFGKELWSALANVDWRHEFDADNTDCGHSFRSAGALIASMLCRGDYMDWYCASADGVVSEYVANAMASKGWRYKIFEHTPDDIKKFYASVKHLAEIYPGLGTHPVRVLNDRERAVFREEIGRKSENQNL